jgi:methenyltetrahydrofolate cyclohydrolase
MNLKNATLSTFIEALAAGSATPGGGSVAAVCAAFSAALCAMVARLTVDKKKYRELRGAMETLIAETAPLTKRFLDLAQADIDAYDQVMAALGLPKENAVQIEARRAAVRAATRGATEVPLETLRQTARLADLVSLVTKKGNTNCITDAGTAALLLSAAAHTAAYNVRINLMGLSDEGFAKACRQEVDRLVSTIDACVAELEKDVTAMIG